MSEAPGSQQMEKHRPKARSGHGRRPQLSCTECRRRKMRCDRLQPCSRCIKAGIASRCHYGATVDDGALRHSIPREAQVTFSVDANNSGRSNGDANTNLSMSDAHRTSEGEQETLYTESSELLGKLPAPNSRVVDPSTAIATNTSPAASGSPSASTLWYGSRDVDSFIEPLHQQVIRVPREVFRDEKGATTYHGRTHEMILLSQFADMTIFIGLSQEERTLLRQLQRISSDETPRSPRRSGSDSDQRPACELRGLLPSQELITRLVNTYIQRFESYYRVLHVPFFMKELPKLWDPSAVLDNSFIAKVIAVCTISLQLTTEVASDMLNPSRACAQWIEAVKAWLLHQDPTTQLRTSYLQVNCLYLIASQMKRPKPTCNTSWISTGTLVRTAMAAGLHRDPTTFVRVSPMHAELRRRLWSTILELDLQASLDSGMLPACSTNDYDCKLPLNLNDNQLLNASSKQPESHSPNLFSESSCQILLAKSWSLRSKICRIINSIDLQTSYEEVLRIDAELKNLLEEVSGILKPEPSNFRKSMFAIHIRKSVLALHRPFSARAVYDPRYLHSRQTCLETSLTILRHVVDVGDEGVSADQVVPSTHSSYVLNTCYSGVSTAAFLVCHELLQRAADEKRRAERLHYDVDCPYAGSCVWNHSQLELLTGMLKRLVDALKADEKWKGLRGWLEMGLSLANAIAEGETSVMVLRETVRKRLQAYRGTQRPKVDQQWESWGAGSDDLWMTQDLSFDQAFPFDFFSDLTNMDNTAYDPGQPILPS